MTDKRRGSVCLSTGPNLVPLIDPEQNGIVLKKISDMRGQVLKKCGLNIQGVHVIDHIKKVNGYQIMIGEDIVAHGEAFISKYFVEKSVLELQKLKIQGKAAVNPINQNIGSWVSGTNIRKMIQHQLTYINCPEFICEHLFSSIIQNIDHIRTMIGDSNE